MKATILDSCVSTFSGVSFIKIDVEGGELDVLRGSRNILSSSKPVIVFECGGQAAADLYRFTKDDFFEFFDELSYRLFMFAGGRFTRREWERPKCYEYWAVHKDSPYVSFFEFNLPLMAWYYTKHHEF